MGFVKKWDPFQGATGILWGRMGAEGVEGLGRFIWGRPSYREAAHEGSKYAFVASCLLGKNWFMVASHVPLRIAKKRNFWHSFCNIILQS